MNPVPAPGDTVGRFTLLSALGDGGMGAVFEATRTDLPLRVALKVMHPALRERTDAVQRFLREAEVLATMRHPHIVDVLDFGVDEAHGPWIAMRLLDGESLRARLRRAR
jgi:serine/threonine-protein kinase